VTGLEHRDREREQEATHRRDVEHRQRANEQEDVREEIAPLERPAPTGEVQDVFDAAVREAHADHEKEVQHRLDAQGGGDAQPRRRAEADELKKIAPRRFNPDNEAWLPIMHRDREGWSFTALYSNTARAHELGTTRDWVVLYYERNGREDQCTVVTETSGPLKGKRVIRGREEECRRYYEEHEWWN
jgi:hypothetical protein